MLTECLALHKGLITFFNTFDFKGTGIDDVYFILFMTSYWRLATAS